ncbi:YihY family inner membrane protein [Tepidimonas taiwanensis]|uniref:YihY family inner membrane protein n=1 Tax=Tepidimonas taiwanensis TaxID=307486 RepID=UPI001E2E1793|nr:YihY family inner membrane protein [Tepidimonas taiwanensis]
MHEPAMSAETDDAPPPATPAWRRLWADAQAFPWRSTAQTLRERFAADRLAVAAGSLTFTTTISLVPLMTVALAVFSAFPAFARVEQRLQRWMIESLVPDHIARQVSQYVWQFSNKAAQIGWSGAVILLITALALVLTIDRQLNDIWRVRRRRPLAQRVLVYWGLLTLGPLLLAAGLSASSYALSVSRGWLPALHQGTRVLLDVAGFVCVVGGVTALYRYVPNAPVRTRHALIGGVFVALAFELAQQGLAWYLRTVPTYSAVYGAFATVPILLIWLYLLWLIVLLGAVVVAYLPSLLAGVARRGDGAGWPLQLTLEVVAALDATRGRAHAGLTAEGLAARLRVDPLQLQEVLQTLRVLGWVERLDDDAGRWALLVDPAAVSVAPLVQRLLLARGPATEALWRRTDWEAMSLAEALPWPAGKGAWRMAAADAQS